VRGIHGKKEKDSPQREDRGFNYQKIHMDGQDEEIVFSPRRKGRKGEEAGKD
jgi:hypothetical protein